MNETEFKDAVAAVKKKAELSNKALEDRLGRKLKPKERAKGLTREQISYVKAVLVDKEKRTEVAKTAGMTYSAFSQLVSKINSAHKGLQYSAEKKGVSMSEALPMIKGSSGFVLDVKMKPSEEVTRKPTVRITPAMEKRAKLLFERGWTKRQIAADLNVTVGSLRRVLPVKVSLEQQKKNARDKSKAEKLLKEGKSRKEIAKALDKSYSATFELIPAGSIEKKATTAEALRSEASRLHKQGMQIQQIAKELGISRGTVTQMKLPPMKVARMDRDTKAKIIKLREGGMPQAVIAETLKLSLKQVREALPKRLRQRSVNSANLSDWKRNRVLYFSSLGMAAAAINRETRYGLGNIRAVLREADAHKSGYPLSKSQEQHIKELKEAGVSNKEIAESLKLIPGAVRKYLNHLKAQGVVIKELTPIKSHTEVPSKVQRAYLRGLGKLSKVVRTS